MRCPYCVTGDRYVLVTSQKGWVIAVHGERIAQTVILIAAACDDWNRFVNTDPDGKGL